MPDRFNYSPNLSSLSSLSWTNIRGPRGAMVARLTPDQKVACSNHVVVKLYFCKKKCNACTGHMGTKRKTLCFLFSSTFMPDRFNYSPNLSSISCKNTVGLRGAMVARLTPDQKVACSNHVVVKLYFCKKNLMLAQVTWAQNEKHCVFFSQVHLCLIVLIILPT